MTVKVFRVPVLEPAKFLQSRVTGKKSVLNDRQLSKSKLKRDVKYNVTGRSDQKPAPQLAMGSRKNRTTPHSFP